MTTSARHWFCCLASLTFSLTVVGSDEVQQKDVHPGVHFTGIWKKEIPLKINILSVDLTQADVDVVVRTSQSGKLKLTELAAAEEKRGRQVFGGINGDYFFMMNAQPLGIEIIDGVLKNPPNTHSALLLNERHEPLITRVEMNAELTLPTGETFKPDITNRWARRGKSALYTIHTPFSWDPPDGSTCAWLVATEPISVSKPFAMQVKKIKPDPPWVNLDENQLLLVEPTQNAKLLNGKLKVGDTLKVSLGVEGLKGPILQAIGGGPRIVRDGKKSVENEAEQMGGHQVFDLNPRCGVGYSKDGCTLMLFAVDGRDDSHSIGLDMNALANIMVEHGVWQGMGLDGGGSISLLAGMELMTRAVGAGVHESERRIPNALMVIQKSGSAQVGAAGNAR